ncbi:MAG: hypothetical protein WCH83_02135 [Alphaproteobacteria bacterium]
MQKSLWVRLSAGLIFGLALAAPASAESCLSAVDQRAAITAGDAIPLARAVRSLPPADRGEVVNARLCHEGERLLYVLTVVNRHGKVVRARLDAATGTLVHVR